MRFEAGQQWAYAAPAEFTDSRIVIGAIVEFDQGAVILCCSVTGASQRGADGASERVAIPFLPMSHEALARTVTHLDGVGVLPDTFVTELENWRNDPRGASYFTVPFEGSLERMIALQMAALVQTD
ncbi:MAG: hypothetical protein AB7L90_13710 [Hyphomicrobiaceae bacterium]